MATIGTHAIYVDAKGARHNALVVSLSKDECKLAYLVADEQAVDGVRVERRGRLVKDGDAWKDHPEPAGPGAEKLARNEARVRMIEREAKNAELRDKRVREAGG